MDDLVSWLEKKMRQFSHEGVTPQDEKLIAEIRQKFAECSDALSESPSADFLKKIGNLLNKESDKESASKDNCKEQFQRLKENFEFIMSSAEMPSEEIVAYRKLTRLVEWFGDEVRDPQKEGFYEGCSTRMDFVSRTFQGLSKIDCKPEPTLGELIKSIAKDVAPLAVVGVAAVLTGGAAVAVAGPIAAGLGTMGVLGTASTGTVISSLSGAALTNASLASIGGGALAAGGTGMVGGTVVLGVTGGVIGSAAGAGAVNVTSKDN